VKYRLTYIFSFFLINLICLSTSSFGQIDSTAVDSLKVVVANVDTETPIDSVADEPVPVLSSMSLIFDYGKLVGLVLDTESKYEAGIQVEFYNKFFVTTEFGVATLEPNGAYVNANYVSEGSYWRAGLGYKIDMSHKYNFMFSFRYGRSSYSDKGQIEIVSRSGIFDTYIEPFDRQNLSAYWYEIVMSSERRVWKGLYAGFHARVRIMGDYDEQIPLDVYSVPGYGRTIDKAFPAINLYVKYAFELF